MAKIGIFGGSFDPIHFGHLILAERCRDLAELDKVLFVPAFQSPLKSERPSISDDQRVGLLKLAISGHPQFEWSSIEIDRQSVSYTVETLGELKKIYPDDELFFLLGSDSLAGFARWKSPETICELAQLLVINRPGFPRPDLEVLKKQLGDEKIEKIEQHIIASPLIEISSSEIRRRIAASESIRYLMPHACAKHIQHQKLYTKRA